MDEVVKAKGADISVAIAVPPVAWVYNLTALPTTEEPATIPELETVRVTVPVPQRLLPVTSPVAKLVSDWLTVTVAAVRVALTQPPLVDCR